MKSCLYAGLAGIFFIVSFSVLPVFAAEPITIVITASRAAETVDDTLAPVTVVTRADIKRRQVATVEEVLQRVPGISISNSGGLGKFTSVFMRGTESDHVLVMIDGVKIGSATAGTAPFQDIPIDLIEKIEVVRGPRSSLYGSEAIGGVIHIFTRKKRNGFKPYVEIGGGSHALRKVSMGAGGGTDRAWYSINAAAVESDGFNACRGKPFPAGGGCFTLEPDDDGYSNRSITLSGGLQLNDRVSFEGRFLNSDNDTEFDGAFQNATKTRTQVVGADVKIKLNQRVDLKIQGGRSIDDSDNFFDAEFASRFDTIRDSLSMVGEIQTDKKGRLILGVDYVDDEVDSTTSYTESSRDNTGVFAQYQTSLGLHDVQFALRNDDNQQFGSKTTGGISVGHDLGQKSRMILSYGTAFKAPNFNELYFPDFSNPDLKPETARSYDLGFSGKWRSAQWGVNLYKTEIDDLIAFDFANNTPNNIDSANIEGIELTASTRLAHWDVGANLTLQNAENRGSGAHHGNQLPRRADRVLNIDLDRSFGKYDAGLSVVNRSDSFDDLGNTTRLDGFTTVDLRAGARLNQNWKLNFKLNNIFDREYETSAYFNQDGINGLITLSYRPRH